MSFPHQDPEFSDLVRIVAEHLGLNEALVEKDYWVTHSLWALHQTRLDIWFKGGTSLSKGFGLIERFSEDLDLKIEPGSETGVPAVANWKSTNKGRIKERRAFFEALENAIEVPHATVSLVIDSMDRNARDALYAVAYSGRYVEQMPPPMRPFVQLEVGSARVAPFVECSLTSFVHEWLSEKGQLGDFDDNRPAKVRCVHPIVTLMEKLDAILRRYHGNKDPSTFIRHYEDATRIIRAWDELPPLDGGFPALAQDMLEQRQIKAFPDESDEALVLPDAERRDDIQTAHDAIAPMFWGERTPLSECSETIRAWLRGMQRKSGK